MEVAAAVLGGLVLLAAAVRLLSAVLRQLGSGAARAGRTAALVGRTAGVRGLLAALAGASTSLAAAGGATAAPAPVSAPMPTPAPAAPASAAAEQPRPTYVVRPGDSLWAIAARHLGPGATGSAIAAEWPRWYRANRGVIGSDPSLIHVGTRLVVPNPRRTGTSASTHHRPAHRDPGRSALTLDPDRR